MHEKKKKYVGFTACVQLVFLKVEKGSEVVLYMVSTPGRSCPLCAVTVSAVL
jgi:hypothetical protein